MVAETGFHVNTVLDAENPAWLPIFFARRFLRSRFVFSQPARYVGLFAAVIGVILDVVPLVKGQNMAPQEDPMIAEATYRLPVVLGLNSSPCKPPTPADFLPRRSYWPGLRLKDCR